jgi:hypothetical protein
MRLIGEKNLTEQKAFYCSTSLIVRPWYEQVPPGLMDGPENAASFIRLYISSHIIIGRTGKKS